MRPTRAGPLRQSTRAPDARTIGTHLSDSAFMKRVVSAREYGGMIGTPDFSIAL